MLVLTHNAYWFQGEPSLWGQEEIRPHPRALAALTQLYGELAPDVICLQEVPRAQVVDDLAAALGMEGVFARGGRRPGYGGAVLWKESAGAVEDLTHASSCPERAFERICMRYTGAWSGGMVTIANVHLSSNRFAPDGQGEPVRLAELEALFGAGPPPDVVVGDFNATPDSRVYRAMVARGYQDAGQDCDQHGRPSERRIDYIWVRGDAHLSASRYGVVAGDRFGLEGEDGVTLSDHHPMWAELRLTARELTNGRAS